MSAGLNAHLTPKAAFRAAFRKSHLHWKRREENKTTRRKLIETLRAGDPAGLLLDGSLSSVQHTAQLVGKALGRAFACKTHPITRQIIVWRLR